MTRPLEAELIDRLTSLHAWTKRTSRLLEGETFESFEKSEMMQLAVSKAIEWTGELSGRILKKWPHLQEEHSSLQLSEAYAMRDRLVHGYDTADLRTIWETVSTDIQEMQNRLAALLGSMNDGP